MTRTRKIKIDIFSKIVHNFYKFRPNIKCNKRLIIKKKNPLSKLSNYLQ